MSSFKLILFLLLSISVWPVYGQSVKLDNELATTLNSEANQELLRRKQFHPDRDAKKVFDNEREKGLAAFLEEQEKWDLMREKGLAEHRRQSKQESPVEGGPEYLADQKVKNDQAAAMEKARIITVETRRQIQSKINNQIGSSADMEELGLDTHRPRYDLRKRGKNKWVKNEGKSAPGTSGGSSAPPPVFDDFPPQPDYAPAPQPVDGFEDIPPPPPMNFDNSGGQMPYGGSMDSGFGDVPPPPPPPPPMDYDF